jgi:hypothetical protein
MKQLCFFLILFTISCSKQVDAPFDAPPSTTQTDSKNSKEHYNPQKTDVYNIVYGGSAQAFFTVTIPAFDTTKGKLRSWKLLIARHVTGTSVITNLLDKENDSSIHVLRSSLIGIGRGSTELPDNTVALLPNTLTANQVSEVPINVTLYDEINSTHSSLKDIAGKAADNIDLVFADLISTFKANCYNNNNQFINDHGSYYFGETMTISMNYTYTANNSRW